MTRLESVSPLVVAWGVALGIGGLLLWTVLGGEDDVTTALQPDSENPSGPVAVKSDKPRSPAKAAPSVDAKEGAVTRASESGEVSLPERPDLPRPLPTDQQVASEASSPEVPRVPASRDRASQPVARPDADRRSSSAPDTKTEKPADPPPSPEAVATPQKKKRRSVDDTRKALALPVLAYKNEKPVSVTQVIREIELLAGVEIRWGGGVTADVLAGKSVQLDLSMTTAGKILEAVLGKAGLTHAVRADYVEVLPSRPASGADPRGS